MSSDVPTPAEREVSIPEAMSYALRLHQGGRVEAAESIYRRILQLVPDHVDALQFLGVACHLLGKQDEALAHLERALALAPDSAEVQNNLGNVLARTGRLPAAEAAFRRVLELRPDNPDGHSNLGAVLRRQGKLEEAVAAYRRAIAIDAGHAESYHNLTNVLADLGRREEALEAAQKALELHPYDGEAYRRLGAVLYSLGRIDDAVRMYRKWQELEPDSEAARHMLAACTGEGVPGRASDRFVKDTFDKFAESFDEVLERLKYRAPELCAQAVEAALGPGAGALQVLDAGCGTGLCGPLLRPWARRLEGADLSPRMLEKAAERKVYDALHPAELVAFMNGAPGAFDLVVSADTLCYFGELEAVARAAARCLRPGGLLVFSVERAEDAPGGYRLEPHGRYSHTRPYVRAVLEAAGLAPRALDDAHLRMEVGKPVEGLVVSAQRPR